MELDEVELKHREWKAEELKSIHSKGIVSVIRYSIECSIEFINQNLTHYADKATQLAKLLKGGEHYSGSTTSETLKQLLDERLPLSKKHLPEIIKEASQLIIQGISFYFQV